MHVPTVAMKKTPLKVIMGIGVHNGDGEGPAHTFNSRLNVVLIA